MATKPSLYPVFMKNEIFPAGTKVVVVVEPVTAELEEVNIDITVETPTIDVSVETQAITVVVADPTITVEVD